MCRLGCPAAAEAHRPKICRPSRIVMRTPAHTVCIMHQGVKGCCRASMVTLCGAVLLSTVLR